MAYTRAEWDKLQKRYPVEDRTTYEQYLASIQVAAPTADSQFTTSTSIQDVTNAELSALQRKQEQATADAAAAQKAAEDAANQADANAKAKADADAAAAAAAKAKADADAEAARKAKEEADAAAARAKSNVVTTPKVVTSAATTVPVVDTKAIADRESMITVLQDRFTKYGLTGLGNKIRQLAIDGATEATITIQLQDTDEYKQRFAANQDRIKKGLSVLSPADYLNTEDAYRQVLRSYGLTQFDNDQYVRQFIANDMSPTEFSNRVVTAVQRVKNADPSIMKTLRDYYGIGTTDLVGYVLDPEQQFQRIQRQVAAAEIGTAARTQGLEPGVAVAEQLAAQGISQAEAQKGYATIADILPTSQKLSEIYGNALDTYGQAEAEQEVFNSLASAQRKRRKLAETEQATFSGSTGAYRSALGGATKGQF